MVFLVVALAALGPIWIGKFEGSGAPPAPWQVVRLNKRVAPTVYRVATIGGVNAIEARAHKSMALLARPIAIDLSKTPILCWKWYVDAPVMGADMRRKSGDDYAARVYVAFDVADEALSAATRMKLGLARRLFGSKVPDAALSYVWDNRNPVGTSRRSAYTDRAQMIVAETGTANAGRWVSERVDVAADFARAFGGAAKPIQLAVASDTDDTGGTAHAAFADLHFTARNQSCEP